MLGLRRSAELISQHRSKLAPDAGKPLTVPALFSGDEFDVGAAWGRGAIAQAPSHIPQYRGSGILPGCGHWSQQERPEEVNAALIEFLAELD